MKPADFLRAAGVAMAVLVCTLLFSVPMVAFYANVIERGRSPEFYASAAQWIAPWSSHILGPLLFFWFNYRGALRRPERNAQAFAFTTVCAYVVINLASVPLFGLALSTALKPAFFMSLGVKSVGAFAGARIGSGRMASH